MEEIMDWRSVVKEQEASGESATDYCAKRGIRVNKFYNWRSKLKAEGGGFARVETSKRVSLELDGGTTMRVLVSDLKEVLAALR
jgi:hypothetical protein